MRKKKQKQKQKQIEAAAGGCSSKQVFLFYMF